MEGQVTYGNGLVVVSLGRRALGAHLIVPEKMLAVHRRYFQLLLQSEVKEGKRLLHGIFLCLLWYRVVLYIEEADTHQGISEL